MRHFNPGIMLPGLISEIGSDSRLNVEAGHDNAHQHEEQNDNGRIGHNLERAARHGAVLMQMGPHGAIVVGHGAQVVLDLMSGLATACGLSLRLFLGRRSWHHGLGSRLSWLGGGWLARGIVEGGHEVHTAIWAKADTRRNLLATSVAIA